MIDVYAGAGRFSEPHALAGRLAETLMQIEGVPNIPMFRKNTAAFIHELSATSISNVDGDSDYVRVQVLTNGGALDRAKQIAVVEQFVALVAEAGWGLRGHAHTNDELIAAARAEIAERGGP
jgi:hypothetical protein